MHTPGYFPKSHSISGESIYANEKETLFYTSFYVFYISFILIFLIGIPTYHFMSKPRLNYALKIYLTANLY